MDVACFGLEKDISDIEALLPNRTFRDAGILSTAGIYTEATLDKWTG